ncbi:MAG: hypothetical protein AAGD14_06255 [Planctomycetota bacterium]
MVWFGWFAFALGALSTLRLLVALARLRRWLRAGDVRRFEAGATPRVRIVTVGAPEPFEHQNYPDYEVEAAGRATSIAGEAGRTPAWTVRVNPAARPDPLFLRDAVAGERTTVHFAPMAIEARTVGDRIRALSVNTDGLLHALAFGAGRARAGAVARQGDGPGHALARRALPVVANGVDWRERFDPLAALLSAAPVCLLVSLFQETPPGSLTFLLVLAFTRAGLAFGMELRFVRDGSTLRAIPLLPLLWILEPLLLLFGRALGPATLASR